MSNKFLSKLNLNSGSLSIPSINYKNNANGDTYSTVYQNTNNIANWSLAGTGPNNTLLWRGVCWSKELNLFVACASSTTTSSISTSPTGNVWTSQTAPNTNQLYDVIWIPQLSLFVACAITGTLNRIITSSNGTSWAARTTPVDNTWVRLAWSPELGIIVCISNSGTNNRVMTSYDAINWSIRTTPTDSAWRGLCWASELGLFVVAGGVTGTNRIMTSSDGVTWSLQTSAEPSRWLSVCWSPELSLLVAVGETGTNKVYTSPDGINWTGRPVTANGWHTVLWSAELGLFVVCAYTGTNRIMTSINGTTWVDYSITANDWLGICWSKELSTLVVVAGSGTTRAAYSINKNNLTHGNSATSNIYSSGFLTLDNSYTATTNRLIAKKMVSQSLRLHDSTISTAINTTGALVVTGSIGLGNNSTTPSRLTFGGSYTVADPGSSKLIALFNSINYTDNHQYYGFGINTNILRYQIDSVSLFHVFYAATSSSASVELFRIKGNQTAQLQYGTALIPSLSFQNDTSNDTGLYRIAEDSMGISSGGKINSQCTFSQPSLTVPFTYTGLLAYYSFRNSLLTDTSANAYTLTNNGTVTTTDVTDSTNGITLYNCATFNGTSQYLSRNTSGGTTLRNAFNNTAGITISLWIYNTDVTLNRMALAFTDATLGVTPTTSSQRYYVFVETSGVTLLGDTGGASNYVQPRYSINSNQWYHIVFVHTTTGISLYVDGVLTTPTSFSSGNSATAYQVLNNINAMYIGAVNTGNYWSGSIKNVMVLSSSWTAAQVQQIYNNQLSDVIYGTNSMYAFTADLKTGLLRQKNNTLALTSNGNTKLYADTAGCVINSKSAVVSAATYTLTINDYQVELSYAGAMSITLPLSTLPVHGGRQYVLIKTSTTGSGAVTINVITPDTINGSLTSLTLTNQYDRTHLTSNGNGTWYTI